MKVSVTEGASSCSCMWCAVNVEAVATSVSRELPNADALKPPVTAARTSGSMGREDETQKVFV